MLKFETSRNLIAVRIHSMFNLIGNFLKKFKNTPKSNLEDHNQF